MTIHIPVAYQTDLDKALQIINETAWAMRNDPEWSDRIIEDPLLLGIDDFNERGMTIKLWLKTLPLKQWETAREYRRRLRKAFQNADIQIPTVQNQVWFQDSPSN